MPTPYLHFQRANRGQALRRLGFVALAVVACFSGAAVGAQDNPLSLTGTWRFRLDPNSVGVTNQWFKETLEDSVTLPGLARIASSRHSRSTWSY